MLFIFQHLLQISLQPSKTTFNKSLLAQCIKAVGYFAVSSDYTKAMCAFGWHQSSLLARLAMSPFEVINDEEMRCLLLPTLISILDSSPKAVEVVRGEFCLSRLLDFLQVGPITTHH